MAPRAYELVRNQYKTLPPAESMYVDLSGKTIIVSGANTGLGKEAVQHFARMQPAKMIFAVRSVQKGEAARTDILSSIPNIRPSSIEIWPLDLADFSSVKAFAARAISELPRLDILLCNAGLWPTKWETTTNGWETGLQANCLATFYLSILLLPLLSRTSEMHYSAPSSSPTSLSKPHLTIVASDLHAFASFPEKSAPHILTALNDSHKSSISARYNVTKLIDVLFARSLDKHWHETPEGRKARVVINSVNPGFCISDLAARGCVQEIAEKVMARPTEVGSRCYLWATLKGELGGSYSSDCTEARPSSFVLSAKGADVEEKLWNEITQELVKVDPSVQPIIRGQF